MPVRDCSPGQPPESCASSHQGIVWASPPYSNSSWLTSFLHRASKRKVILSRIILMLGRSYICRRKDPPSPSPIYIFQIRALRWPTDINKIMPIAGFLDYPLKRISLKKSQNRVGQFSDKNRYEAQCSRIQQRISFRGTF